mmetsp:Transcript_15706/g.29661  ORF Transcript_15706/g.29661 Transcript_15706/m.29661 type:complete len:208 (-) Transcript_15706:368-991(-)
MALALSSATQSVATAPPRLWPTTYISEMLFGVSAPAALFEYSFDSPSPIILMTAEITPFFFSPWYWRRYPLPTEPRTAPLTEKGEEWKDMKSANASLELIVPEKVTISDDLCGRLSPVAPLAFESPIAPVVAAPVVVEAGGVGGSVVARKQFPPGKEGFLYVENCLSPMRSTMRPTSCSCDRSLASATPMSFANESVRASSAGTRAQ